MSKTAHEAFRDLHEAGREFLLAVSDALRLPKIVGWLNDRLTRR